MKKILFAIDNQKAERKLSELIKDASAKEEYQVVGTPVSNESVLDFLQNKTADILVYMEGLSGKEDSFDFVLKLHKRYPHLRIVFIAGQREIGDKKLATLVAFHIYDIIAGQKILMPDVAKRILNPAVFEDVVHYLPDDGNDVFKDTDFNRSVTAKEAQNETDRIAEKASAHKQILDAKNNAKTLALKLDAAEAKARMLEDEKANWEIAAGKERMLLERKFDEDRKILCAQIDDLNRKIQNLEQEKSDIETQCRKLEQQLDAVSKNLESSQKQSSATIKALQIEREGLVEKYDNIIRQHDACQRELDSLKQKIKQQKDDILSDAQKEADKIIENANSVLERANMCLAESESQKQLQLDRSFEEYKAAEMKKIEDAQNAAAEQIAKERELAKTEREKIIFELDNLIRKKENAAIAREEQLNEIHEENKQKRSNEILNLEASATKRRHELDVLDKAIVQKKAELSATQEIVDITRKDKEAELVALEQEYANKLLAARENGEADIQLAITESQKKCNEEMCKIENAFATERKRLAKEFDFYKHKIEAEKKRIAESSPNAYRYDESDFVAKESTKRNTKCKIMMFYSPTAGSGNSSVAINTATFLAKSGQKTIYMELNWQSPSMKDNLGIAMMKSNLNDAIKHVCAREYQKIDKHIISKQQILNLKTQAKDAQMKYPDMLSFISYTREDANIIQPTAEMIKGLIAYLKYKKNYVNIVIDLPSYASIDIIREVYAISNRHIFTICQDIISVYSIVGLKTSLSDLPIEQNMNNATYVVNKYIDGTILGPKKIAEVCGIRGAIVVPQDMDGMILAAYKSVPAILISKNRQVVSSYKEIAESIL